MFVIWGNDCSVQVGLPDIVGWFEVMCQSEMKFSMTQQVITRASATTGFYKEKSTRLAEATCSVTGLTETGNSSGISFFYFLPDGVRRTAQNIRLIYTDESGAQKSITGTALIKTMQINKRIDDFAIASIDFDFTGSFQFDEVIAPPQGLMLMYSDYWTPTGGNDYVDGLSVKYGYSLQGKKILEVNREGAEWDFVGFGTSTPGNRECRYNNTLHRLVFGASFDAGERVWITFTD